MDAGIATEANLIWLSEHGYRYLVVSANGPGKLKRNRYPDRNCRRGDGAYSAG